ncbi:class I adenylate-forming enzyme family protein [Aeromicrobium alkaliterrae]|uniref:AMP-binding protein n=1 Tax=Aeromicrobium alkaliterrae TaxID=302168 RepID=A0ABP4WAU9_9ACTN
MTNATFPRSADARVDLYTSGLGTLLRERAAAHPDRVALVGPSADPSRGTRRFTYAELLREVQAVAAGLSQRLQRGERLAVMAQNNVEWLIVQSAAATAGLVLVAVNPLLTTPELRYILQHSGAAVLLRTPSFRGHDIAGIAAEAARGLGGVREILDLAELGTLHADPTLAPDPDLVDGRQLAMLQYTSGTTGTPKCVMLNHVSVINDGRFLFEALGAPDGMVAITGNPLFHTGGCVAGWLGPLYTSGTLILVDHFVAAEVMELARTWQADILITVATMLTDLVDEARRQGADATPKVRYITTGAANVPRALLEGARHHFDASLHNVFGMTEASSVITAVRPGSSDDDFLNTLGTPLTGTEVAILDPATGETVPPDVEGEIAIRGSGVMIGYKTDTEEPGQGLDADGWFRTGDLGRVDDRGYLTITGRLKDLIIRGGENIAPAEIENRLAEHPAVIHASVVGIPHERLGEEIVAVVHLREEATGVLLDEIKAHCFTTMGRFKVPTRWFTATEFPMTASRKIQRFRLQEQVQRGDLTPWA